jgi:hypothetical protein
VKNLNDIAAQTALVNIQFFHHNSPFASFSPLRLSLSPTATIKREMDERWQNNLNFPEAQYKEHEKIFAEIH